MPNDRKLLVLLIIVLVLLAVFGLPVWPYAVSFGWGPSGLAFVVLVVLIVMVIAGRL